MRQTALKTSPSAPDMARNALCEATFGAKAAAMTMNHKKMSGDLAPPLAAKRPEQRSAHGQKWHDDYAWIRAGNWREVLRDPANLPAPIRELLEAENAYADAALAGYGKVGAGAFASILCERDWQSSAP